MDLSRLLWKAQGKGRPYAVAGSVGQLLLRSTAPGASPATSSVFPRVGSRTCPDVIRLQVQMGTELFLVQWFSDWYQGL